MFSLKVPNGHLVMCSQYKWVSVTSGSEFSHWQDKKQLDKDVQELLNDNQFKKTEGYALLQSATAEQV